MIVLVTGGREYFEYPKIAEALEKAHRKKPISMLIHGGATGADLLSARWALGAGIHVAEVKPLWDYYGNGAGPVRNRAMLLLGPEGVVAFPGGNGTADMVRQAEEAGIPVWRPYG